MMSEPNFRADRLDSLMKKLHLSDGQLALRTGISRSMIHYLRRGERKEPSALHVVKLASALKVSFEYLMGISDSQVPQSMELTDVLFELAETAKTLPLARQRDLLLMAQTYGATGQTNPEADAQLMSEVFSRFQEAGDEEGLQSLIALLCRLLPEHPAIAGLCGDLEMPDQVAESDG